MFTPCERATDNPFHYVNLPEGATKYDRERDCQDGNCIIEALEWYKRVMVDKDAPKNMRVMALRFVAHLVGDIHQPLHAGKASDRGGNDISINFNGRRTNLHALWDVDLVEAVDKGTSKDIARRLNETLTVEERAS